MTISCPKTAQCLLKLFRFGRALALVVMVVVGSGDINAITYSHTITSKTWSAYGFQTLTGVTWTAAATEGAYWGYEAGVTSRGQQFGSESIPATSLTLSTSGIYGTISSVKVTTAGASGVAAVLSVSVGGTSFTPASISISTTSTAYTFTGSKSGTILISWSQSSSKALYLKALEVTYTAATPAATPTFSPVQGTYTSAQSVTLSSTTLGAKIYYTTNGTDPTSASTLYSSAIAVSSTTTIKAIAYDASDSNPSAIASATYTISLPTAIAATSVTSSSFTANWNAVAGASGYKIDVYKKATNYATDLIISEYVEGTSNNKYLEIFNGTSNTVNLADYRLRLFSNGATGPSQDVLLSGNLASGSTLVYKNSSALIYSGSATNNAALDFNGNDAVALYKISSSSYVDIFGRIGDKPGTEWTGDGSYTTLNKTLVRKANVTSGITTSPTGTGPTAFTTLTTEWDIYNENTVSYLGSHSYTNLTPTYFLQNQDVVNVLKYTVSSLESNTEYFYVVRAYNANGTSNNSNEISVTTQQVYRWKGNADTNWSNIANWVGGVIPVTDASIGIATDAVSDCNLDIDRAVSDIVNASTDYKFKTNGHKLTVKGSLLLSNNAKIDASTTASTVEFGGSSLQAIPSGAFVGNNVYNLTVNNTSNVTLAGTLNILNSLSTTTGRFDAITNTPTINFAGTALQTIQADLFTTNTIQNLTINNAAGVIQNSDITVSNAFTINSGKWYQINAAKALTVNSTVTNLAGVGGLIIKAGNNVTANASFIYPQNQTVQATVEFFSKASWDKSAAAFSRYKWQYFGIPVSAGTALKASPTFDGAFVRKFNEAGVGAGISNSPVKRWLQLTNTSELVPFAGYEIVQAAATNYYIQGTLVNNDFSSGQLTYTTNPVVDTPGSNIFSNPYTAAIDIQQLIFGAETEAAVYQFHTGSHYDWGTNGTVNGESVGQYIVSPKSTAGNAGIPRYISSMQGFLIKKLHNDATNLSNFTFNIPYSAVKAKNTTAMRSPEQEKSYTTIDVAGNRFADKVWIFIDPNCSRAYDNGWDGRKLLGSVLTPQLLIREAQNDLQISAVDNINNTVLAFQPGEDAAYTLTFKHTNSVYPELYLLDAETNSVTDISATGSTYSFIATASTTPVERFKIVTGSNITTGNSDIKTDTKIFSNKNIVFVNNKSNCAGTLKLIDITGKMLLTKSIEAGALTSIETGLVAGNYIALFENCERAFRQTILIK